MAKKQTTKQGRSKGGAAGSGKAQGANAAKRNARTNSPTEMPDPSELRAVRDDEQRVTDRSASAFAKYPLQQELEENSASKLKAKDSSRKSEPKGKSLTVDDVAENVAPNQTVQTIEHGATAHPRSEHEHRPGGTRATVEGPAPRHPRLAVDDNALLEQIRLENKADSLYYIRQKEREAPEPRDSVIDAINARLREVQGEPIQQ